ncbi:hypothetical protein I3843_05G065900 [Carya illinoinensis]|uniref:3-oxo-5-alpha-steroid 4-dehydrogenase C-terminal domain-containing protein n=1 Tax=Carya illinoinensis TaxID=32201 RepID=A0A8T1QG90_CARIL|nr:polyprenol reductase 2-like isoform X2 [Carya illinoinensis]KAG2705837.1 hypothetical protein I3760_05G073900 [Carya illinoinensis]KAG6653405.1 hypothetical protein CIPAW_05G074000 [Carya illinoinensis]KAG7978112.1 hypothetical protein I3843_05G065900 [Carya illinoinensis]
MEVGLVGLLRAAWIAGTLPILIASLPSSRLSRFRDVLSDFAKRGKTMQYSSQRFTVPQRFFCHFYWVAVVWTTLLLVTTWMYAYTTAPMVSEPFLYSSIANHLTGGQVLRRLFETIYVFNYSPSARMHIFGYLTGLFFYVAAPLSLCCNCIPEVYEFAVNGVAEFIVRGKSQMPAIEFDWWEFVKPLVKLGWRQWVGAVIFFGGWVHQRRCHAILGSLRDHVEQVDEYVIPHGDWFEIVSSPHYLAEIVIYASLVVASGGADLTIWLLFAFVVANLVFAAAETHRWYLRKFDNYPSNRFVIIPFIY